uniref:NADH-ubiquinone oxidoreductase chain 2 n=1 Tax=Metrocoris triangulatus TaxID=3087094 RepID=A0AB38Z6S7_9HEMI|nr:NADH dehydrogenase subunit 2 [Metrocoris triangulatus]WPW46983.1 NADH dehydrogenase subunit 2 [Metrocoris triangulatus]
MIKTSTKMLMMVTLILSTIMVLSSENWFSMWMGLEINMMSFIPMMEKSKNRLLSEAKMMYFLIQSMGSIIFIFMIIMNPMIMIMEEITNMMIMNIIAMSMMMKMGMAPMHMWFINIMNKMSWNMCLTLMTWQKIAPMYILSNTMNNIKTITIWSIMSAMIGAIGGVNQTSVKKIMAFSSINHLGWMTMCMKFDNEMWIKYLIIYSTIIILLVKIFSKSSINYINQMNMNMKTQMEKTNLLMLMLSLGGLPPFIGFMPKWLVIQSLIMTNSKFSIMILMMTSMITLFYYMRLIVPTIMSYNISNKWNNKNINMKTNYMYSFTINMMLPITMIINMM